MAGRAVNNGAAVAVEKVFPSRDAAQLAGIVGCGRNRVGCLTAFETKAKALPLILTSVIREPLVAFPLEICAVKLGALVFTEITGSLRTFLSRRNTQIIELIGDVGHRLDSHETPSCAWIT